MTPGWQRDLFSLNKESILIAEQGIYISSFLISLDCLDSNLKATEFRLVISEVLPNQVVLP